MTKYTTGGKINTTTVLGNTFVGVNAPDGGVHVILDDATHVGVHHPCGAIRVNSTPGPSYYDPSGAVYTNHLMGPGR